MTSPGFRTTSIMTAYYCCTHLGVFVGVEVAPKSESHVEYGRKRNGSVKEPLQSLPGGVDKLRVDLKKDKSKNKERKGFFF